jgi:hypothetical protein
MTIFDDFQAFGMQPNLSEELKIWQKDASMFSGQFFKTLFEMPSIPGLAFEFNEFRCSISSDASIDAYDVVSAI